MLDKLYLIEGDLVNIITLERLKTRIMKMKNIILVVFIGLLTLVGCSSSSEEWISLFNGENLDGWEFKFSGYPHGENFNETFRVENGNLIVDYKNYNTFNGEFGHLFTTQKYSHYRLRVEYKFFGEQVKGGAAWAYRNNGLMLHAQSAKSMQLDQDFPTSIEVQLLGGIGDDKRTNMNVCTPGSIIDYKNKPYTNHCLNSKSEVVNGELWTSVEVEILGDSIVKHFVDGRVVLEYSNLRLDSLSSNYFQLKDLMQTNRMTKGHIAIQAESHGTMFRKIELLNLSENCD